MKRRIPSGMLKDIREEARRSKRQAKLGRRKHNRQTNDSNEHHRSAALMLLIAVMTVGMVVASIIAS